MYVLLGIVERKGVEQMANAKLFQDRVPPQHPVSDQLFQTSMGRRLPEPNLAQA